MVNLFLMLLCYCLLLGLAFFYYRFTRLTGVESFGMAVVTVIAVQLIAGVAGNTAVGTYLLYAAGLTGIVLFILPYGHRRPKKSFFSLGMVMITAGFAYALIAFWGAIIHNIDEFTQWAKAARYIYETGLLPVSGMFSGVHPAGTTLFHHFFLRLTGYLEQNLYCSGFLLSWTGLMLPLSALKWKDWKQASLYVLLVFIAQFSLYMYPYMNIYVDMPIAAWAGGMTALWYLREKRKELVPLLIGVLFILPLFKWAVGPIFAVAMLFLMVVVHVTTSRLPVKERFKAMRKSFRKKSTWLYFLIPLLIFISIFIWSFAVPKNANPFPAIKSSAITDLVSQNSDRAQLTIQASIEAAFSRNMGVSGLNVSYFAFIIAVGVLGIVLYFFITDKKKNYRWLVLFCLLGAVAYLFVLILNYLNTFTYVESIRAASIQRYFSIYAVFVLPIALAPFLLFQPNRKFRIVQLAICGALVVLLCCGINEAFYTKYLSASFPTSYWNYKDIAKIHEYSPDVNKIVPADSKILLIAQNTTGFPSAVASYDTYERVPNPAIAIYDFSDGLRVNEYQYYEAPPINEIDQLMIKRNYDYMWVYKTDAFFSINVEEKFHIQIDEGGLYRIHKSKNKVTLEKVVQF